LFDQVQGNWPDLRVGMKGCSVAWCHGAPGIALGRLRGAAVDPSRRQHHLAQIDIAVSATQKLLNQLRDGPCSDTSLCHGKGGLIETIATVGHCLGRDDLQVYAQDYLQQMLVQHGDPCSWPSGTLTQEANPSLMLGLAGIGHLFLRFHAPTRIRSVLLVSHHTGD
jgi:lantibiotic biosynthesis protein